MTSKLAAIREQIAKLEKQAEELRASEINDLKTKHLDELSAAGLTFEEVWGGAKPAKPTTEKGKSALSGQKLKPSKVFTDAKGNKHFYMRGVPNWAKENGWVTADNKIDLSKAKDLTDKDLTDWEASQTKK